ncbi:MAG: hypothetical protein KJO22_09960 [Bacteroidia bacterium]|nr:hypothetical protein [Bacteroidia bacterium]
MKDISKEQKKRFKEILNELNQALIDSHPENKKILQAKLLRFNVELAKMNLDEYPKTQRRAKVAYIISIFLALLQLTQWIVKLLPTN